MLPDRVSNPGALTYESGALPIALRGPAAEDSHEKSSLIFFEDKSKKLKCHLLQFLFGALRVKK